jgi:hypothetical protein
VATPARPVTPPVAPVPPRPSTLEDVLRGLPAIPLSGSSSVPLEQLLAWRAEACASAIEYASAKSAAQIAALRLAVADDRLRASRGSYLSLVGRVVAEGALVPSDGKGKGRERALTLSDDSEDGVEEWKGLAVNMDVS